MKRWLVALVLVTGCAKPAVSLKPPATPLSARAYVDVLKRFTRHGHVIDDFDETITVDVTLHGPEFRSAFAEKWIEVYKIGPDEAAQVREQLGAEVADTWELHLETSSHTWDVDNLIASKKVWRVALLDDKGREIAPREIKLDKTRREVIEVFYPYANIFSRSWKIRFPRTLPDGTPLVQPDTKSLTLRIAGPKGSMDLVWEVKDA